MVEIIPNQWDGLWTFALSAGFAFGGWLLLTVLDIVVNFIKGGKR